MQVPGDAVTYVIERFVRDLREPLQAALQGLPERPTRASDIQRSLGLAWGLSWQIAQLALPNEPLEIAPHVPGRAGFRKFLEAMIKAGAVPEQVEQTRIAFDCFDNWVRQQLGSRDRLKRILTNSVQESSVHGIEYRKAQFRGASSLLGVETRVQLTMALVSPSTSDIGFDITKITGVLGFQFSKPHRPWPLGSFKGQYYDVIGNVWTSSSFKLIAPPLRRGEIDLPVLTDLSSKPIPDIEVLPTGSDGTRAYLFSVDEAGVGQPVDCLTGYHYSSHNQQEPAESELRAQSQALGPVGYPDQVGLNPNPKDAIPKRVSRVSTWLSTPCEAFVLDVLLPREAFTIKDQVFHLLHANVPRAWLARSSPELAQDVLKIQPLETISRSTDSRDGISHPLLSGHADRAAFLVDRFGYELHECELIRVEVQYPLTPSEAVFRLDITP